MRKIIGTFAILLTIFLAVGFYRGWIGISTESGDKTSLEVSVDKESMKADAKILKDKVKEKVGELSSGDEEDNK